MTWEYWVAMALFNMISTNEKNKAFQQSKRDQDAIMADNETKRLALEKITKQKQDDLLQVVDKENVVKDSKIESNRINDLMKSRRSKTPDAIVSKNSPQIVKDAMASANETITGEISKQGLTKANLQGLTGQFDKYAGKFDDANTLAKNVAGKLRGNEGVMNIGMREASDPYSAKGDLLQNLTNLFSMYAMSQGGKGDPKVVDGVSTDFKTAPRKSTYDSIYTV